ncbi:hypothetical protein, partial [Bradyrhizobium liaoningense]|uniref:hypothetical protein n=1 Tax=Bradyrhizobium liaoningense TaxID=43992 RepID=UPI001BAC9CBC
EQSGIPKSPTFAKPSRRRGIQYAAAFRLNHCCLWNTGLPAFAGNDSEFVVGSCHKRDCEEPATKLRSNFARVRAKQSSPFVLTRLDCFASLAMTNTQ